MVMASLADVRRLTLAKGGHAHYDAVFDRAFAATDAVVSRYSGRVYNDVMYTCMCFGNWQLAHQQDIAELAAELGIDEAVVVDVWSGKTLCSRCGYAEHKHRGPEIDEAACGSFEDPA